MKNNALKVLTTSLVLGLSANVSAQSITTNNLLISIDHGNYTEVQNVIINRGKCHLVIAMRKFANIESPLFQSDIDYISLEKGDYERFFLGAAYAEDPKTKKWGPLQGVLTKSGERIKPKNVIWNNAEGKAYWDSLDEKERLDWYNEKQSEKIIAIREIHSVQDAQGRDFAEIDEKLKLLDEGKYEQFLFETPKKDGVALQGILTKSGERVHPKSVVLDTAEGKAFWNSLDDKEKLEWYTLKTELPKNIEGEEGMAVTHTCSTASDDPDDKAQTVTLITNGGTFNFDLEKGCEWEGQGWSHCTPKAKKRK